MSFDHTFRFADDELNRLLRAELAEHGVPSARDADGTIAYSAEDEERFEDILAGVRRRVFPDWQVLSFPPSWAGRYRATLRRLNVPFAEEVSDGAVEFLIAGHHEPHAWEVDGF